MLDLNPDPFAAEKQARHVRADLTGEASLPIFAAAGFWPARLETGKS
jgi:hypothetical protein